jgi:hypothetical protein
LPLKICAELGKLKKVHGLNLQIAPKAGEK